MTKTKMLEFIVDMFNKHATSPIGDTDKKYIIKVACERNKKWEIENRYLKCLDLEKLQCMRWLHNLFCFQRKKFRNSL